MKVASITYFDSFEPIGGLHNRLESEFQKRGHTFTRIKPDELSLVYDSPDSLPVRHALHDMGQVDIFHTALRAEDDYAWEIVECLRSWGKFFMQPERIPHGDKVTMARLFTRAGVKVPRSAIASTLEQAQQIVEQFGYPVVGKARTGSEGRNVRLIDSEAKLHEFVAFAQAISQNFLLQETILPLGRDVRAFVVGDKVVAAMERFAAEGDFRANYSLSGKAETTLLTPEETEIAVKVADIYKAAYAGIDFVRTENGPVVLEINKGPGLRGIESVTGINVAGHIVDHFEACLRRQQ